MCSEKKILKLFILNGIFLILFAMASLTDSKAQTWENLPGHAKEIAVGGDSTDIVWTIGRDNSVYKWVESSFSWQSYGGEAKEIAVSTKGIPWVINDKKIYRLRGEVWQSIPGKAVAIGAGGNEVWIIGNSGSVYRWNENSFTWEDFGGDASEITVDSYGIPWVINKQQIYRLRGQTWQSIPGKATAIGAGGGEVWTVGQSEAVFRWNENSFGWINVGGKVSTVAAGGSGTPYAVQSVGTLVYRLNGYN